MSEIKLHVDDLDGFFRQAQELARRLDRGEAPEGGTHLSFESMELLLRVLTPNRWLLLKALRRRGPSSIRALAKALERDYRGVHADVTALREVGLVQRDEQGRVLVPWSRIVADVALDAAA